MSEEEDRLQAERAFILSLRLFDGMEPIPKLEASPDDDTDENADQKKDSIRRERDEKDRDDGDRDKQSGGALQAETEAGRHGSILMPFVILMQGDVHRALTKLKNSRLANV
jgi:hypothetical protein